MLLSAVSRKSALLGKSCPSCSLANGGNNIKTGLDLVCRLRRTVPRSRYRYTIDSTCYGDHCGSIEFNRKVFCVGMPLSRLKN